MKRKFFLPLLATFLIVAPIQSRVHFRRVGPDYRTEEQKQKESREGMGYGILVAIAIGGIVIWGKIRDSR